MRSNIPLSQKEYDFTIDKIKVCGTNRGPHDYIAVAWTNTDKDKWVKTLMCRVCFNRVSLETLFKEFEEVKFRPQ